ncbi:hypothetical protein [Paenibacillus sp. FSL H8-0034]
MVVATAGYVAEFPALIGAIAAGKLKVNLGLFFCARYLFFDR